MTSLVSVKSTAFAKAIFFAPRMDLVKELVSQGDFFLRFPRDDVGTDASGESTAPHSMTSSKMDPGTAIPTIAINSLTSIFVNNG